MSSEKGKTSSCNSGNQPAPAGCRGCGSVAPRGQPGRGAQGCTRKAKKEKKEELIITNDKQTNTSRQPPHSTRMHWSHDFLVQRHPLSCLSIFIYCFMCLQKKTHLFHLLWFTSALIALCVGAFVFYCGYSPFFFLFFI